MAPLPRVIPPRRTCAARVPAVVGGLAGFGRGTRPLVGGIRVRAAPRSGVVAIATVHFSAALPAAACPAGARAVAAAPVRSIHNYSRGVDLFLSLGLVLQRASVTQLLLVNAT